MREAHPTAKLVVGHTSTGPYGKDNTATVFVDIKVGLYPIVTSQYSSTNLYQVSYHI